MLLNGCCPAENEGGGGGILNGMAALDIIGAFWVEVLEDMEVFEDIKIFEGAGVFEGIKVFKGVGGFEGVEAHKIINR